MQKIERVPTVYVADLNFLDDLCKELGEVEKIVGNLVFSPVCKPNVCFALDVWFDPQILQFESISQAAKLLRQASKYMFLYPVENIRRSKLISESLRKNPSLDFQFPLTQKLPPMGAFSLLDQNTLVYSTHRLKTSPLGYYPFKEDKTNPPNRAYLKLWEALTLCDRYPAKGETAIDLGASPGGWTYVMSTFGCTVYAVDKAPLAPAIAKLPVVKFMQQSAFAIDPADFNHVIDWVLCDVACYPDRTFDLIQKWIASGKARYMIFTIKLQGDTDHETIERFKAIDGASVVHLFQNKHEVTFLYCADKLLCIS